MQDSKQEYIVANISYAIMKETLNQFIFLGGIIMANIANRRTEKVELTAVSITGEPKKLKAEITYQQKLTMGQYIGIGITSITAAGVGWYFGRLASRSKNSKVVKIFDKLFGIEDEDEEYDENFEYVDIDVVDEEE